MRVIVFTGKGGAGVSTLAAATAAAIAEGGRRTLAFGVGSGLADAFAASLGSLPVPVAADLWALEAASPRQDAPGPFLTWLRDLSAWRDTDETMAENIATLPGLVDLARLLLLEEHLDAGKYEAVVLDCPALRHTLDLLAALDVAARALDRLIPTRQRTVLEPFLRALSAYSPSGDQVYEGGRDLVRRLGRLRQVLADSESASVRLVLTPERGSVAETQRAVTALNLFAYPVDAAICNRLTPEEAGAWFQPRREEEQAALDYVRDAVSPLPVFGVPLQQRNVSGLGPIGKLGESAYRGADAAAVLHRGPAQAFSRIDGSYILDIVLPFVRREELAVERIDDALIVHVGERSRVFDLPAEARRMEGVSSALQGDTLRVTFKPED